MGNLNCATNAGKNAERDNIDRIRKQQEEIDRLTEKLEQQQQENEKLKNMMAEPTAETASMQSPSKSRSDEDSNDDRHDNELTPLVDANSNARKSQRIDSLNDDDCKTNAFESSILSPLENAETLLNVLCDYVTETERPSSDNDTANDDRSSSTSMRPVLTLLYRCTRDGDEAETFHRLCDDKGPTITLIRDKNYNIFGGYNSLSWSSPDEAESREQDKAFLFILKTTQIRANRLCKSVPKKFTLHRTDYEENREYATQDDARKGPIFGISDLYLGSRFTSSAARNGSFGDATYDMGGDERYLTPQEQFWVAEMEVIGVRFD